MTAIGLVLMTGGVKVSVLFLLQHKYKDRMKCMGRKPAIVNGRLVLQFDCSPMKPSSILVSSVKKLLKKA